MVLSRASIPALSLLWLAAAPALLPGAAPAAPADTAVVAAEEDFRLSVRNIMRGEELVGTSPSRLAWSADSRYLYFRWREPTAPVDSVHSWRIPADGSVPERLEEAEAARLVPGTGASWTPDRTRRAAIRDGDVYVADTTGREWRITETAGGHRGAHLSPDGSTVYFMRGNDLFAMAVAGGPLRQLTDIRAREEPADREPTGHRRFLQEQERELLDAIRERVEAREEAAEREASERRVEPTFIGPDRSVGSARVSPSGRYVLLGITQRGSTTPTLVLDFVTETGYSRTIDARPKVGDRGPGSRVAILDLQGGGLRWIETTPEDRPASLSPVGWAPHDDRALLRAVSLDDKDRWLHTVTPAGEPHEIEHLHDEAWVAGPGFRTAGWLPDGRGVYFVSERSGFAHLYTAPAEGGRIHPITSGEWEVHGVELAADGRTFYLTTNRHHPGVRTFEAVPVAGGALRTVTPLHGWTSATLSPDERWIGLLHSVADRPAELLLMENRPGARPRQITRSTTAEFEAGPWIRPEIVTFDARDGATVYARIYRPEEVGAERTGAAVLFVHGAGYLQNAHHGWSTYYREYMFHHLLASRGYLVLDVDYRGSAGYGAGWRTGIYRSMGGKDLTDHTDAVRWLVEGEGIDPGRVGIYGGSYGGFITLMAMFTKPALFQAGAALRAVTDWAHYNHGYTSRILNLPHEDPEAYRRSSPIHFAEGLEGHLLITHGMVDTNVQFQDVVRLAQRLIELGKENWELAVYPVEGHAFQRPESWADQYRRILELFDRTIGEG